MKLDQVLARLRAHEAPLRAAGIGHLFLFGSMARDTARDASDVEIFFDAIRADNLTLFDLGALRGQLQKILETDVDPMTRAGIHPRRRPRIEASAVQVF